MTQSLVHPLLTAIRRFTGSGLLSWAGGVLSGGINALAAETSLASGDEVAIRDVSEGADNRATLATLFGSGFSSVGQLSFPATQNASAGANVLDDYEEGTWTPTLQFGGAAVGMTYGALREGTYVKIGKVVLFRFRFNLTAKGSSTGAAAVTGLPFTVAALTNAPMSAHFVTAGVIPGDIRAWVSSTSFTPIRGDVTGWLATDFTNTTEMYGSGYYEV